MFVVTNLTQPMSEWDLARKPDYASVTRLHSDVVWLEPGELQSRCGASCILVLQVNGTQGYNTSVYKLMATRDVAELSDGVRLEDYIASGTTAKYYKYYKTCGSNCDFEVILEPMSTNANMTIAVDNPTRLGDTGAFDFSKAIWAKQAHSATELVITSDDLVNSTSSLFVVGVGGKAGSQYFVTAWAYPHQAKTGLLNDRIGFKKLQVGVSPDFDLKPSQIRYLYYENWVNAPVRFDSHQALGVTRTGARNV